MQDVVERNYSILNEKFGDGVTSSKNAIWARIALRVSVLRVAVRTPQKCKDRWTNTKRESTKVFPEIRRDQAQTGDGKPSAKLTQSIERAIDLCNDSSAFKGLSGFESTIGELNSFHLV